MRKPINTPLQTDPQMKKGNDSLNLNEPIHDCPHCGLIFANHKIVEGHIMIDHGNVTKNIIKCVECKKVKILKY